MTIYKCSICYFQVRMIRFDFVFYNYLCFDLTLFLCTMISIENAALPQLWGEEVMKWQESVGLYLRATTLGAWWESCRIFKKRCTSNCWITLDNNRIAIDRSLLVDFNHDVRVWLILRCTMSYLHVNYTWWILQ